MIEENGYSLVNINNDGYKPLKLALWGQLSKSSPTLHLFLREQPINKKCALNMNHSDALKRAYSSVMGIDSHIKKLRKKSNAIETDNELVQSVYSVGYRLVLT